MLVLLGIQACQAQVGALYTTSGIGVWTKTMVMNRASRPQFERNDGESSPEREAATAGGDKSHMKDQIELTWARVIGGRWVVCDQGGHSKTTYDKCNERARGLAR